MATGNLYVCIKPFAVGEVMTSPADDPEHWALYLLRGEKGDPGPQGIQGERGSDGRDGVNGKDGTNGRDGVNGADGTKVWLMPATLESGTDKETYIYTLEPRTDEVKVGDVIIGNNGTHGCVTRGSDGTPYFLYKGMGGVEQKIRSYRHVISLHEENGRFFYFTFNSKSPTKLTSLEDIAPSSGTTDYNAPLVTLTPAFYKRQTGATAFKSDTIFLFRHYSWEEGLYKILGPSYDGFVLAGNDINLLKDCNYSVKEV